MKKIATIMLLSLCFANFGIAQQKKDEIQLIQATWGMEKRTIVTDYMKFTSEEATVFWPVYDEFQTELRKLGSDRMKLISDYSDNLANLTNEKADQIITALLKNNAEYDKLQSKYYGKMKKLITPLRAAAYMQLEYYLLTMIRAQFQNSIPMIGELDKKAK